MKPKTVRVCRKFNLGNYQTLDFELSFELEGIEDAKKALLDVEKLILEAYQGRPSVALAEKIGR